MPLITKDATTQDGVNLAIGTVNKRRELGPVTQVNKMERSYSLLKIRRALITMDCIALS